MSAEPRPWWASDADALDPDLDPVVAHRAARRGDGPGGRPDDGGGARPGDDRATPGGGPGPGDDESWWGPAADAVGRLARDLAALAAERAATAGARATDVPGADVPGAGGDAPRAEHAPDHDGAAGAGTEDDATAGGAPHGTGPAGFDACGVCPVCVGLRALGDARPELAGHLAEAARHLALAVRTVVDAATEAGEAARPDDRRGAPTVRRRPPDGGLERIDLDG